LDSKQAGTNVKRNRHRAALENRAAPGVANDP